jgi:hypothetical protein
LFVFTDDSSFGSVDGEAMSPSMAFIIISNDCDDQSKAISDSRTREKSFEKERE